jgi:hypothetical protein
MADTPKLDLPEIAEAQASKYVTHNTALRMLDCLVQLRVKDKDLSEPPGAPSDGDTYIVGATSSSSSDWNGHDDEIAYYNSSAWLYITPDEGFRAWVEDEQRYYVFLSASDGWVLDEYQFDDYDVHGHAEGVPGGSQVMIRFPMVRAVRFPDEFAASQAKAGVAAGDSLGAEFSIQKNDAEFAQMTFASGATTATFATDSAFEDFAIGDILTVIAPASPDSTLAGVSFVLKGFKI